MARPFPLLGLTLFIVLLLIPHPVSAGVIYDSWSVVGKPITASGLEITTAVDDSWDRLILSSPEDSFIIPKGDCKKGRIYEYCYLDKVIGQWVPDAAACDRVYREAAIKDLTPNQARAWITQNVPGVTVDLGDA